MNKRKLLNTCKILVPGCFALIGSCQLLTPTADRNRTVVDTQLQESVAIRPGEPGKTPFWNEYAKRFIYAPAFNLPEVPGATSYEFSISASDGKTLAFRADKPWTALSAIWKDIPEGSTTLKVTGLNAQGKTVGTAGEKAFYRSPGFQGEGQQPDLTYKEASRIGLKALFDAPAVQYWLKNRKPDPSYSHYSYPSKIIGGVVRAMIAYSKEASGETDRKSALEIAKRSANYLISVSFPQKTPYPGFPPTYLNNVDKPVATSLSNYKNHWLMVVSSVDAALGYLDLYDVSADKKYLDAATKIAGTLLKTQQADGTWPHMVNSESGAQISPQRLIPTWILFFFDRLTNQYKLNGYSNARSKAWDWIIKNPLKTYQWDGQFEDIKPRDPYMNLAREQACDVAFLLLDKPNASPAEITQAEDLLRFSEDQFVVWSPVKDCAAWRVIMPDRRQGCDKWITPCVLEQYACYDPVARSSAILINTYLKAYKVTRKTLYFSKAKALTNGLLAGQKWLAENANGKGEIPTWVMKSKPSIWLNNSYYAAEAVLNMSNASL